jgi:hypothetical protein
MADTQEPIAGGIDEEECILEAALKAIKAKKARLQEEAEEKRRVEEAEEKRKAKEAEEKCQADEAEAQRVKKAQKAKEAEEAEKIRAANVAMEKKRVADDAAVARVKAQAQATRQRNLVKIGVAPNDPLMLVPEGLGPGREEVWNIRKQVAGQAKKRKLGDTEASVHFSRRFGVGRANLAVSGCMHLLCTSGPGVCARDWQGVLIVQRQKGPVLLPGSKTFGRDHTLIRRGGCEAEAEEGQDVGDRTEGRAGLGSGGEVGRRIGQDP